MLAMTGFEPGYSSFVSDHAVNYNHCPIFLKKTFETLFLVPVQKVKNNVCTTPVRISSIDWIERKKDTWTYVNCISD